MSLIKAVIRMLELSEDPGTYKQMLLQYQRDIKKCGLISAKIKEIETELNLLKNRWLD